MHVMAGRQAASRTPFRLFVLLWTLHVPCSVSPLMLVCVAASAVRVQKAHLPHRGVRVQDGHERVLPAKGHMVQPAAAQLDQV